MRLRGSRRGEEGGRENDKIGGEGMKGERMARRGEEGEEWEGGRAGERKEGVGRRKWGWVGEWRGS